MKLAREQPMVIILQVANGQRKREITSITRNAKQFNLQLSHTEGNTSRLSQTTPQRLHINNMGGSVSEKCNELAKHLWYFCIREIVWISAVHIPGKENTIADYMSRSLSDNTEWKFTPIFKNMVHTFNFVPELALFVSYLNVQVPCYVSWFQDPDAVTNDAFNSSWENKKFYAFPPFSLIGQHLQKFRRSNQLGS